MSLRWPPVREAWLYRDPCEIGDGLVYWCQRQATGSDQGLGEPLAGRIGGEGHKQRDRYYTMWRRAHLREIMCRRR